MTRVFVFVLFAAVFVFELARAFSGTDDADGKVYDFNVVVQPRAKIRVSNTGTQESGEFTSNSLSDAMRSIVRPVVILRHRFCSPR